MARIVNAKYSTFIGTVEQIDSLIKRLYSGKGAVIVNLDRSNFVALKEPLSQKQLEAALRIAPK